MFLEKDEDNQKSILFSQNGYYNKNNNILKIYVSEGYINQNQITQTINSDFFKENKIKEDTKFNLKNEIQRINNEQTFISKLDKLKNSMKCFAKNNSKEINFKNFQRDIFINYSNNIKFVQPNISNENIILLQKEISNLQKENTQNINYLGHKIKRENSIEQGKKILNNKSNDENKNLVMFKDGILKIRTNELIDSNENNDINQFNYYNLSSIKKLLIQLNYKINTEKNKSFKRYYFYISNILIIITVNIVNYEIIEIYEKKGDKETRFNSNISISKELCHIKSYLEKRLY